MSPRNLKVSDINQKLAATKRKRCPKKLCSDLNIMNEINSKKQIKRIMTEER